MTITTNRVETRPSPHRPGADPRVSFRVETGRARAKRRAKLAALILAAQAVVAVIVLAVTTPDAAPTRMQVQHGADAWGVPVRTVRPVCVDGSGTVLVLVGAVTATATPDALRAAGLDVPVDCAAARHVSEGLPA